MEAILIYFINVNDDIISYIRLLWWRNMIQIQKNISQAVLSPRTFAYLGRAIYMWGKNCFTSSLGMYCCMVTARSHSWRSVLTVCFFNFRPNRGWNLMGGSKKRIGWQLTEPPSHWPFWRGFMSHPLTWMYSLFLLHNLSYSVSLCGHTVCRYSWFPF